MTANEGGNHQVCVENYGSLEIKFDFEFLSGIAAKDYSEVAKKSNLKPIELSVYKSPYKASKTGGYDELPNAGDHFHHAKWGRKHGHEWLTI